MNKAITDGVVFMPPPFAAGLGVWARGDGVPGSDTYASTAIAAFVPADQDFGGCLEIEKTDIVQKLRHMGQTPILPGCYLQVTARVKAVSGPFPTLRIAAFAAQGDGSAVTGIPVLGPETTLSSHGEVVEIRAIIGTGNRPGVDMVWGMAPAYAHVGLDITGPTGAVVRIDDLVVEDATEVFRHDLIARIDVRDFGAVGDGSTDDSAAFEAADAAAAGREILVPAGVFRLEQSVTFEHRVRFEGRLEMATDAILSLTRNFDLPSYVDAFGDEALGFAKAIQSLMNNSDHESLDMGGRRVSVSAPIDLAAAVPNRDVFAQRRVIRNGQLRAETSPAWAPSTVTSSARYSASNKWRLTDVDNVANIEVGALVTGTGVGREVYVRGVDIGAQEVELSQPLGDVAAEQGYSFTRFRYLLDFSGFSKIEKFEIEDVEFQCTEQANGVLLAPSGTVNVIRDCVFNRPAQRAITSPGEGCQGILIDHNQFISAENGALVQDRQSVAITTNGNDVKIRNNRASQFRHFAVVSGIHSIISGNHFFQGDSAEPGLRSAGIVLTTRACNASVIGNYVDNCFVEWTNERETSPDFSGGFGFAGLSLTGNVFLASDVASHFAFIVVKPFGSGHFVNGLAVSGNTFRIVGDAIDRVERVDDSIAPLDLGRMRKVSFAANTFNNVELGAQNPLIVHHDQAGAAPVWTVSSDGRLPFAGHAAEADAVLLRDTLRGADGGPRWHMPHAQTAQGPNEDAVRLTFPEPVSGSLRLQMRMDG